MSKRDFDRDKRTSEGGTSPSKKMNKSNKSSELTCPRVSCNKPANKDCIECEFCHDGSITSVQELPRAPMKYSEILLQMLCYYVLYANLKFP